MASRLLLTDLPLSRGSNATRNVLLSRLDDTITDDSSSTTPAEQYPPIDGSVRSLSPLAESRKRRLSGSPQSNGTRIASPQSEAVPAGSTEAPNYEVSVRIPPSKFKHLPYATGRTGLVYDVRMRFHEKYEDIEDILAGERHPEDPRRIATIFNILLDAGLVARKDGTGFTSDFQLLRIGIRDVKVEDLLLVHSQEHIDWVIAMRTLSKEQLIVHQGRWPKNSIYVNQHTASSAILSAGGAVEATKSVLAGQVRNAIALIRPPGHHAEHANPEGFCFFNNVCIAARVAQRDCPELVRKVLILDWDVHHGNGIQRTFYEDPNVLYISLHVYNDGEFYPGTDYGNLYNCGDGAGRGKNINIPWPEHHMGDGDYIYAFQQLIMPVAVEFDPDLVLISAGFDAADGDTLGLCHVSPACYGHMTHMLMQLAKGRVVSCLEGGYNLESIAKSALSMTRVMMGEPPDRMAELKPTMTGIYTVTAVIRQQAKFWQSIWPKLRQGEARKELGSQRMHDVVRAYQAKVLLDEHQMLNLFVRNNELSKSYDNQVLATPNFREERPLLVVFHDPPEVTAHSDMQTSVLQLHNTWLTDVSKTYIDWAIKQGFAAIDVNIPKHYTDVEDNGNFKPEGGRPDDGKERRRERARRVRLLAQYLWRNYVEPFDSTHLFLLGVGDAYAGIVDFLTNEESAIHRVNLTVGFIGADYTLPGLRGEQDDMNTFYKRSRIFVSMDHPNFGPPPPNKPKKRFGTIIASEKEYLQDMLRLHRDQITKDLLDLTEDWRTTQELSVDGGVIDEQVNGNLVSQHAVHVAGEADSEDMLMSQEEVIDLEALNNISQYNPGS